jgi:hypothetical protein
LVVQPRQDGVLGEALGPLIFRLEGDGGFGHVDGRGIGGGFGAADFADDLRDLGVCGDDRVLPAEDFGGRGQGDAWVRDGHKEGSLFIERRHEL